MTKYRKQLSILAVLLSVSLTVGACDNNTETETTTTETTTTAEATPAAETSNTDQASETQGDVVTVNIESVGEQMKFDKETIEVPAGSKVKVVLKNNATSDAMKHNFIVAQANSYNEIGAAGAQAGEAKEFIPESDKIIAYTPLAGPGQTVEVTFDAPPAGTYDFLCSFPGHYVLMRGTFVVK